MARRESAGSVGTVVTRVMTVSMDVTGAMVGMARRLDGFDRGDWSHGGDRSHGSNRNHWFDRGDRGHGTDGTDIWWPPQVRGSRGGSSDHTGGQLPDRFWRGPGCRRGHPRVTGLSVCS